LCSEEDDEILYAEFTKRFLPELSEKCLQICRGRNLDNHIGRQVAHESLEKVRKYKGFRTEQITINDCHKGILVYLFRIATNLFNDYHRKNKSSQQVTVHKTYLENIFETVNGIDAAELKQTKDFALNLFNRLNKKEQKVVLTDIEYKKFFKYLPDDVNERLAEELDVKPATVRKIRERAVEKLQKFIYETGKS
jgi:DNA-directed RNA polymerase specialized sigma24 family protein